jgi:Domain of unknown function (DUF4260)
MMNKLLRAEGLALLAIATFLYSQAQSGWLLFALLFFVPDVSFLAYLGGPKLGVFGYNCLHSTIGPILLFVLGHSLWPQEAIAAIALIWAAHVGFDRALGYGLKYASGFKDTHLGRIGN